ncbi:TIGR03086 family metal-binding protein [Nocardioides litoris]|uniref:TIGR03086 family metal-binding protein n=1 Tax=Nocardioides litoris TaxID=1926648 RepID=UPI0011220B92|nr:TIGR03086 family metal-binding protein [Nocardioides litoris]
MSDLLDLGPATRELARLVRATRDDQLDGPTPCPSYRVSDLCDHVRGLVVAFTHAATREPLPGGPAGPVADGTSLPPDWREEVVASLDRLAAAWTDPAAHDGVTWAGPVELPGPVAAQVALDEVVVHGWDLAVATGQAYDADPAAVATCLDFVTSFAPPEGGPADQPADEGGLFGPPVEVPAGASDLDRLVAAAGRRPDWTPGS